MPSTHNKILLLISSFVVLSIAATGCSTVQSKKIRSTTTDLEKQINSEKNNILSKKNINNFYIPHEEIILAEQSKSERILKIEAKEFTLRGYFDEINNLSSKIASMTNIPVIVEQGITNRAELAGKETTLSASSSQQSITQSKARMPFSYSGDLGGLLNLAASKFNVNWEWIGDGKKIRFFKTKSKTYDLRALAGSTTFKNKVMKAGGSGSSGSGSGSSEQETGVDSSGVSVWEDITKSIEIMLSPEGSVIASQSTGKITVTDTPVFLNVIDNYIESVNETLLKQVVINVRVLAVDISDSESYGLNWDAIYSNIDKNFSVGLSSPFSQATGAADFAVNILSKGKWAGTKAFIQALSTQGDVSQVTSSSEITMNHQPVPIQVGREKSYLASSQTTLNNTVSSTTLQPDLISTGFSMNLVPNIMNNQEILLQFGADISTLINIESISSGGSTIQVPEIETRNFVQRVKLRTGDTLVVSGFEQSNLSGKRSSVGNDAFGGFFNFLGGSTVNSDSRTALVILIQPIILD